MKTAYISVLTLIGILLVSTHTLGQDVQKLAILKADTSYRKEIIPLPVEWAPGMTLEGFEELRFSPGWSDTTSTAFWSYVLAWDVKATAPLSSEEIVLNLERYFDGLMKPNHWATTFPEPVVILAPPKKGTSKTGRYEGKMKYFDGFHSGQMITTYILAEQTFCPTTHTTIVVFRISPKPFHHSVWKDLKTVTKKDNSCATKF